MFWFSRFLGYFLLIAMIGIVLVFLFVSGSGLGVGVHAFALKFLLITVAVVAIVVAAGLASSAMYELKLQQELAMLNLYCSNCQHLKQKRFFGGIKCNVSGDATTLDKTCASHSSYLAIRRHPLGV
jgi:hypothetical protein